MILIGPIAMFGGLLLISILAAWLGTEDDRRLQDLLADDERIQAERDRVDREREHADDDWTRGPAPRPVPRARARVAHTAAGLTRGR